MQVPREDTGMAIRALERKFGMSRRLIGMILKGESRRYLTQQPVAESGIIGSPEGLSS